jgi:hypothetical protein
MPSGKRRTLGEIQRWRRKPGIMDAKIAEMMSKIDSTGL